MLRLLALSCLIAGSAQAQERPHQTPTTNDRVVLVLGATAGVLTVPLTGPFAIGVVALTTYGTSRSLGLDPTVGGVLIDTALGMALGAGAGYATYGYLTQVAGSDADLSAALGSAFVGLVVGSVATGVIHGARVQVAPAALAAPTGERTTGLSLRVGL